MCDPDCYRYTSMFEKHKETKRNISKIHHRKPVSVFHPSVLRTLSLFRLRGWPRREESAFPAVFEGFMDTRVSLQLCLESWRAVLRNSPNLYSSNLRAAQKPEEFLFYTDRSEPKDLVCMVENFSLSLIFLVSLSSFISTLSFPLVSLLFPSFLLCSSPECLGNSLALWNYL